MDTRAHILMKIETFLASSGTSAHRFGKESVGDHKFVSRLRRGAAVRLSTIERAERYLAHGPSIHRETIVKNPQA